MPEINIELKNLKSLMEDIDLRKDFLNFAKFQLHHKFGQVDIMQFLQSASDASKKEEKLVLGAYLLLDYALYQYNINQNIDNEIFEVIARYLELTTRYSVNQKVKYGIYYQRLLLTSICYDLANKVANTKVIIKKLLNIRKEDDEPLNIWDNLQFNLINDIIYYLSRDIFEFEESVKFGINQSSSFKVLVEEEPGKFRELLGFFQLINAFDKVLNFWQSGESFYLNKALDLLSKSKKNFEYSQEINLFFITELLEISFKRERVRSIHNLPNNSKFWIKYKNQLIQRNIIELWPSQLDAIQKGILDDNDFVVSAPTSAGKSFIAEICIINELSLNQESKIAYIVPSRALASQAYKDLNKCLVPLGFNAGILVGGLSFPQFDEFILKSSAVIVFTLEKFDILYNQENNYLKNLQLLIIDEAHNLGDNIRGLNLEILLTNIKKDKDKPKKILTLSAVTPNPDEFANWLNIEKGKFLKSNWSPTRAIHSLLTDDGNLYFYGDLKGFSQNLSNLRNLSSRSKTSYLSKIFFRNFGTCLIFNTSRPETEKYAKEIYDQIISQKRQNKKVAKKIKYIMGENSDLAKYIQKGIAYHHAGLPPIIRELIEELIIKKKIKIITSTTTLAEGINTPVSSIIIPSLWIGDHYIPKMLFRNLAGRAGRALESTEGFIVLMETDKFKKDDAEKYILSNIESIEDVKSFLEKILKSKRLMQSHPETKYERQKRKRANLEILSLQKELLSALIQRTFDGFSISKFLNITFFGYRQNKDKIKRGIYNEVKELLNNSLGDLESLALPVIEKHSPYKPTKFGYLCNNIGLLPTTMNNITTQLEHLLDTKKISENLIHADSYSNDLRVELLSIFNLFKVADEVRLSQYSENFIRPDSPKIILSWLNGDSYKDINQRFFKNEKDTFSDTVIFCENYLRNYGNWISFAIFIILKEHFNYKIGSFIENLPFFLSYGTLNILNGIFQALKIDSRTNTLKNLVYHLTTKYPDLKSNEIGIILNKLKELEFTDFLYSNITEYELNEVKIIWDNFKQVRKNVIFANFN